MVFGTGQNRSTKRVPSWLVMRGRDAVRKSTLKVNIVQVFTIDFLEIQFIVNRIDGTQVQRVG